MATVGHLDDTYCVCEKCQQSPSADRGMVACDTCNKWFHYQCVGVDDSIKNLPWNCDVGQASQRNRAIRERSVSAKSATSILRQTSMQLELLRLDEEKALQEEYMRKRYEVIAAHLQEEAAAGSSVGSCRSSGSRTRMWIDQQREFIGAKGVKNPIGSSLGAIQKVITKDMKIHTSNEAVRQATSTPTRHPGILKSKDTTHAKLVSQLHSRPSRLNNINMTRSADLHNTTREQRQHSMLTQDCHDVEHSDNSFHEGLSKDQIAARQVWPKRLPIFSGDPEEWPIFISSYENANIACGFSHIENLIRLQECLKGPALDAVRSRLFLPQNVPKVIDTLRKVYGRPELLIRALIVKVQNVDPPKVERLDTVINFAMAVQQLCDHLEAANQEDHLSNPALLQELVDKLPATFKLEWVRFKRDSATVSMRTFHEFMDKLLNEASEVTYVGEAKGITRKTERSNPREKSFLHIHNESETLQIHETLLNNSVDYKPCALCQKQGHRGRNCEEFRKLSVDERLDLVDRLNICKICLNNHGNIRCRHKFVCNINNCGGKHHSLLHYSKKTTEHNSLEREKRTVTLRNGYKTVNTYAFFDEGSSRSLIERAVADKLGIKGDIEPLDLKWTANVTRTEKMSMNVALIVSSEESQEQYRLKDVHTVEQLNLPRQSFQFNELLEKYPHLLGLPIRNQQSAVPTLLVGLDNIKLFAPTESRIGKAGEPVALRSKLGWTICGPRHFHDKSEEFCGVHQYDAEMNQMLKDYFNSEETCINSPYKIESAADLRARKILESTTVRVGNCFETGLLWRTEEICLPDSFPMALRRLQNLEKRFKRTPDLKQRVLQEVDGYLKKGYAHKATPRELQNANLARVWYLPMNVVLNRRKPGKIRLTLDAAAKVDGISLNDMLLKGPDLMTSLPKVISHFREKRIGFGGDIREMFHQIRIKDIDKQAQRFLFRADPTHPVETYIINVVIFGATCSPCTAQFIKNINALESSQQFPAATEAIINRHYVDDYFDSADSEARLLNVPLKFDTCTLLPDSKFEIG